MKNRKRLVRNGVAALGGRWRGVFSCPLHGQTITLG